MSFEFPRDPTSYIRLSTINNNWLGATRPLTNTQTLALASEILRVAASLDRPSYGSDLQSRIIPVSLFFEEPSFSSPSPKSPEGKDDTASNSQPRAESREPPSSSDSDVSVRDEVALKPAPDSSTPPDTSTSTGGSSGGSNFNPRLPTAGASWDQQVLTFFTAQLQTALNDMLTLFQESTQTEQAKSAVTNRFTITPQEAQQLLEILEDGLLQKILENIKPKPDGTMSADINGKVSSQGQASSLEQRLMQQLKNVISRNSQLPNNSTPTQDAAKLESSRQSIPDGASSQKQLFSDLALKLLSINQLGRMFVSQDKNSASQRADLSLSTMISELRKMVNYVDHLKGLLRNPSGNISEKFYFVVAERLKDISSKMSELTNAATTNLAPGQKQAMMDRLLQETEWLATIVSTLKPKGDGKMSSQEGPNSNLNPMSSTNKSIEKNRQPENSTPTPNSPHSAPLKNEMQRPTFGNEHTTFIFSSENGKTMSLLPQMPRNAPELAGMIQTHLGKSIMQPLPIIVPYPISITLNDPINETQSSQADKKDSDQKQGKGRWGGSKESTQMMILIPAGPVIFGDTFDEGRIDEKPIRFEQLDPFLIAATPVTNRQFSIWLSDELLRKTIHIEHPGKIYDTKGRLLAMTIEGALASQIELSSDNGVLEFRPLPGKDHHPVVHVTYFGAEAFCEANGFRLPTEEEWERAAGMMPTEYGQPLKKLRYANSSERLTPEWAVYRETSMAKNQLNLTMPVGFFDGQRVYTKNGLRVETAFSSSPWGCSDMSGNVREWTSTEFDEEGLFKNTKGGSYGDTQFDLRVAAKIPLPPALSDPYTGFRVVL